jgi:hypothetical protein
VRRQSLSVFRLFASASKPTFRTCFADSGARRSALEAMVTLCLCGPASEELFCGPITRVTEWPAPPLGSRSREFCKLLPATLPDRLFGPFAFLPSHLSPLILLARSTRHNQSPVRGDYLTGFAACGPRPSKLKTLSTDGYRYPFGYRSRPIVGNTFDHNSH